MRTLAPLIRATARSASDVHPPARRKPYPAWLIALGAAALAVAVRPLFDPALGQGLTFLFAFPAVVVAGWYGGWWPGMLATALCVLGNLGLLAFSQLPVLTTAALGRFLVFLPSAVLISALAEQLHRARRALEKRVVGAEEQTDEMQRLTAELERSQNQLLVFLENNPALVWLKDADLRYVLVNESASRSFGIARDRWIGRTDVELFGPEVGARMRRIDEQVLRENHMFRERKQSPADERLHYIVHRFPLAMSDGRTGVGAIAIDVTREMRVERQLREADRRKDTFIATLAHELRNPLAPLKNAAYLLARKPKPATVDWAIGVIDRQVTQMARLLDDLLDVSRITRDRLELRREPVSLKEILDAACEQSRPLLENAQQTLRLAIPVEPIYLNGDKTRLAQVFANLLNNAARYSQGPGVVAVAAERDGDHVVVRVKDTGIGIAPEALDAIFDMFAQGHPLDRRSPGGLGIGLSLVKGLVELHGGSVSAYSAGLGKGSEFTVRLPLLHEAGATGNERAEAHRQPPELSLRVLVVDDNRDNADSMGVLLESLGHRCLLAYSGREALARFAEFRPEVVLLDIGLPDITGYECARRMRAADWGRSVLLVAMTGWGQSEDKRQAAEAGFDDHLTKPVDLSRLAKILSARTADPPA